MSEWQDFYRLTQDEDKGVRASIASALGDIFLQAPDKAQAWHYLHKLIQDEDSRVRINASYAFHHVFLQIPDKAQAWEDLQRLTQDKDSCVRGMAASILGDVLSQARDKAQAWKDLHKLTQDKDSSVRATAAFALGPAFSYIPDKAQAWEDLHMLTQDKDSSVREMAAFALGPAFSYISDKTQAWHDLHKLTHEDSSVRATAALALGPAFSYIPDKAQAWEDLHMLTQDKDSNVRATAALALGPAFSHVPDKAQVWYDLDSLTQDKSNYVRIYAYYSLGRASVCMAAEANNDRIALRNRLEAAIGYFEKSAQEASQVHYSPARFCYSFYRTYFAIAFQEAKEDVIQRYLAEAKEAVGDSKSKDELLKAVENLANALKESQHLKERPIKEIVDELNAYRWYCDKAAGYMTAAEDKAPLAVKLMRICNPIIDERIKATIAEIQRKAGSISPEIERAARCLSADNPIKIHQCCMRMASLLRTSSERLPVETRKLTCNVLIDIEKEKSLSVVVEKIEIAMAYTLPAVEAERKEILDLLRNIEFGISKLTLSSGSARKDLYEIKTSIGDFQDKFKAKGFSREELDEILMERDHAMVERLETIIETMLQSVKEMLKGLSSSEDADRIQKEIQGLKQSKRRDILGIMGDIYSLVGLLVGLIGWRL